jgi:hypothetical protein
MVPFVVRALDLQRSIDARIELDRLFARTFEGVALDATLTWHAIFEGIVPFLQIQTHHQLHGERIDHAAIERQFPSGSSADIPDQPLLPVEDHPRVLFGVSALASRSILQHLDLAVGDSPSADLGPRVRRKERAHASTLGLLVKDPDAIGLPLETDRQLPDHHCIRLDVVDGHEGLDAHRRSDIERVRTGRPGA